MRPAKTLLRLAAAVILSLGLMTTACWKVDPDLMLSASELNFGTTKSEADVTVTNDSADKALTSGVTELDYQFKSDRAWITVNPVSGHLGGKESITHTIAIDRDAMVNGENLATVTVTSNGGNATIIVHALKTSGNCSDAPSTPATPTPGDGADDVSPAPHLSWQGGESQCVELTAAYDVYFGTTTPPPLHHDNGSSKSWDPGALQAGTTYYWRIVAKDENGSTAGAMWEFRTAEIASCTKAPGSLETLLPRHNAVDVPLDQILSWSGGDSQCPGLTATYDVYFGTETTPPLDHDNESSKSWDPGTLQAGTTYYWRVVAKDDNGSTTSPTFTFRTEEAVCTSGPSSLGSLSPADNADDVSLDQNLSWSGGDSQCAGLTATYDVYFGTATPAPFHHNNGTNKSWDPGPLADDQSYYWRIVAKDANGSVSSSEREFRTLGCDEVTAPCSPSPPNEKDNVNPKANLAWGCGANYEDACPDDDVSYVVYFGTSSSLTDANRKGTTRTRSYNLETLSGHTTYYWKVVTTTPDGSKSGPVWSFRTK